MTMIWIRYLVLTLGTVYLLTESAIFAPYRYAMQRKGGLAPLLAYCRACTGYWVGLFFSRLSPFFVASEDTFLARTGATLTSACLVMLIGYAWSVLVSNAAWHVEVDRHHDVVDDAHGISQGVPPVGDE